MFNNLLSSMRRKITGCQVAVKSELPHIKLSRIRFYDVGRSAGVAARCSFVVNDVLQCREVEVPIGFYRAGVCLKYPVRELPTRRIVNIFYPENNSVMKEIEAQVREAYVRSVPGGFGGTWKCNRPGGIN
ncbi:MAG: hypothetical protein WDL87_01930 [Candidatus Omnitrophota bacterium]|jgi:hypothetical protein